MACGAIIQPVTCGSVPCHYNSQCEATAAGYPESQCCREPIGACTTSLAPVTCGACWYPNADCAQSAGYNVATEVIALRA